MKVFPRAVVALFVIGAFAAPAAFAQKPAQGKAPQAKAVQAKAQVAVADKTTLATDRDKVSYMVGMDVGNSIGPVGNDMDLGAFERAVRNAFDGGKPLIDEAKAKQVGQALIARIAARNGQAAAAPPEVSREDVGLLVGSDVGRALTPAKDEIDLPTMLQALRTSLAHGPLLLSDAEARTISTAFSQRQTEKLTAAAAESAEKNQRDGAAFLATNKATKGVYVTHSGLQYMVLRQGAGPRPKPADKVKVNYRGTLLDGTEFDSSYGGQPAEFALTQVIPGWSEGVAMMPVGAKYRFWIPGELAYGPKGTPGGPVGPNATLVFDVELLGVEPQ